MQKMMRGDMAHLVVQRKDSKDLNAKRKKIETLLALKDFHQASQGTVSLDSPVGDSDDLALGEFIQSKSSESAMDSAFRSVVRDQIETILNTLTEREKDVIMLRFGLTDGVPRTLEEVARHFQVTRERVRQIEHKSIKKLKHPSRIKPLRELLDDSAPCT